MSVSGSQQRTVLHLLEQLRPHWRSDRNLPARIQSLLAGNRSFGSRDRRLYRELVYTALRYLPWIEPSLDANPAWALKLVGWLAAELPATKKFREALIADWPPCPAGLVERQRIIEKQFLLEPESTASEPDQFSVPALLPQWFSEHCPAAFEPREISALVSRAPLWLRLQTDDRAKVLGEFKQLGWRWEESRLLPSAVQVFDEVDVTKTAAYEAGQIEIQDLGSQLLLESAAIQPGERWLDACAGAGGKTLQLARLLGPTGHVDAHDIRPAALREASTRALRAGLRNIRIVEAAPTGDYDGVLVDAPCSGSGTWRRAPHLKRTTTSQQIHDAGKVQLNLLEKFSARVRAGGRLFYATCSLSSVENEFVVTEFLRVHPEFAVEQPAQSFGGTTQGKGLTFMPALHNTDGFFVAALRRRADGR